MHIYASVCVVAYSICGRSSCLSATISGSNWQLLKPTLLANGAQTCIILFSYHYFVHYLWVQLFHH